MGRSRSQWGRDCGFSYKVGERLRETDVEKNLYAER